MVIYLSEYRAAPGTLLKNGAYGEDITVRDGPHFATVCAFGSHGHVEATVELSEDLSDTDVDAFMNRMYALASKL